MAQVSTIWYGCLQRDHINIHHSNENCQLNSSYDTVYKIGGANGLTADLHEFTITPEGTALMTLYEIVPGDVSMFREFDPQKNPDDKDANYIWDGVFQEINLDTGDLIFEWRASEHVNVTETYRPVYGSI